MPIYAYKCASCGYAKDMLQKISDAPLTVCPQCGQPTFHKQVTAAGFQLKGMGWYVTDFRGGASTSGSSPDKAESKPGQTKSGEAKTESQGASPNSGATSAPAAAAPSSPGGANSGGQSDS